MKVCNVRARSVRCPNPLESVNESVQWARAKRALQKFCLIKIPCLSITTKTNAARRARVSRVSCMSIYIKNFVCSFFQVKRRSLYFVLIFGFSFKWLIDFKKLHTYLGKRLGLKKNSLVSIWLYHLTRITVGYLKVVVNGTPKRLLPIGS